MIMNNTQNYDTPRLWLVYLFANNNIKDVSEVWLLWADKLSVTRIYLKSKETIIITICCPFH